MHKPVKPLHHGIIDYIFAGIQVAAPIVLKMNKSAGKYYSVNGTAFGLMNALTDTPVAVKPVISMKTHQKFDAAFLAVLTFGSFAGFINRDKRTVAFHLGFLAVAITHYVLTDYNAD